MHLHRVIAASFVLATVGCGQSTPPDAEHGTPDPTTRAESPTPTGDAQLSTDDLAEYCPDPGDGYPLAAEYTGNRHTIALFSNDIRIDIETPQWHRMLVGGEWTSWEAAEIELLGCGEASQKATSLGSCVYSRLKPTEPVTEFPLREQTYDFTVFELRTGRVVDRLSLSAEPEFPANPLAAPPLQTCPRVEPVPALATTFVYPVSDRSALEERFDHLLRGPAQ